MKLRLAKGSVRLRVLRSEVSVLQGGSRLEETLRFGTGAAAQLTYALQISADISSPAVSYANNEILVSIPAEQMVRWATSDDVGIYAQVETGQAQQLTLTVEKDFACLDRNDAENADTYDNPKSVC